MKMLPVGDVDDFERRPKTDYTYARSVTYSPKFNTNIVSPNLSRRRLHGEREYIETSGSVVSVASQSSKLRVYGSRTSVNLNHNNNTSDYLQWQQQQLVQQQYGSLDSQQNAWSNSSSAGRMSSGIVTRVTETTSTTVEEESAEAMARQTRSSARRSNSRSRSPEKLRKSRGGARWRGEKGEYEAMEKTELSNSFNLSTGLDDETGLTSASRKSTFQSASDVVTEASHTEIDTVATGSPLVARALGFLMFVYGFCCILVKRSWWAFGEPLYSALQRYLCFETWLMSRSLTRRVKRSMCGVLLFLMLLAAILAGMCGLHVIGVVNIPLCGAATGVHYIQNQNEISSSALLSERIKSLFTGIFAASDKQPITIQHASSVSSVDWESVMQTEIAKLKNSIETELNTQLSKQKQKNTEADSKLLLLMQELEAVKRSLSSVDSLMTRLDLMKVKLDGLSSRSLPPDHTETLGKLQHEIRMLRTKLGDVDVSDADLGSSGVLAYLFGELQHLKKNASAKSPVTELPPPCPGSSCVCQAELAVWLQGIQERLLAQLKGEGERTTVVISSANGTGLSEEVVKKMIREELDIFSADGTGMPDFALQSMGAQVVSTRCAQTYSEQGGLMTFLGIPLYHLHRDPSVVIQPGVTPGDCWCFHGSSGSLVIELADYVIFNSFSLEHISAAQSATGEISSAPKDFAVYGLNGEFDYNGRRIGTWMYDKNGPRLQFFPVLDVALPAYPVVELRVLSNWGKQEFTCLYRFRVHGKLGKM